MRVQRESLWPTVLLYDPCLIYVRLEPYLALYPQLVPPHLLEQVPLMVRQIPRATFRRIMVGVRAMLAAFRPNWCMMSS